MSYITSWCLILSLFCLKNWIGQFITGGKNSACKLNQPTKPDIRKNLDSRESKSIRAASYVNGWLISSTLTMSPNPMQRPNAFWQVKKFRSYFEIQGNAWVSIAMHLFFASQYHKINRSCTLFTWQCLCVCVRASYIWSFIGWLFLSRTTHTCKLGSSGCSNVQPFKNKFVEEQTNCVHHSKNHVKYKFDFTVCV